MQKDGDYFKMKISTWTYREATVHKDVIKTHIHSLIAAKSDAKDRATPTSPKSATKDRETLTGFKRQASGLPLRFPCAKSSNLTVI